MQGQLMKLAAMIMLLGCNSSISIKPPNSDTRPPSNVAVSSDQTSITAPGKLRFALQASDNVGITKLELREGNAVLGQLNAPGTLEVDYSSGDVGLHTYTSVAFDAAGNNTSSSAVSITVNAPSSNGTVSFVGSGPGLEVNQGLKLELNPPATQKDDLLIAIIALNAVNTNRVNTPAGWSILSANYPLQGGGNAVKALWIFTKRAADETSASFTWAEASNARGVILAYRNVSSWLEARRVNDSPTNNTIVAPNLDLSSDALVLRVASLGPANHEREAVPQSGLSVRYNSGPTLNLTLTVADEALKAGSSGERTFTSRDEGGNAYNEPWSAITIALK
jgi:hypothetical protein